jgi:predicted Na+-dependent transporter
MPIWLYTLGGVFTTAANIQIPFSRLVINLFTTIGPCLCGLLLSKFFPKLKPTFIKIVKPLMIFTLLSFLALTMYARFYVFYLINLRQWLVGPLIPWTGFLLGGSIAKLARLPYSQIITIGIETGIQNAGIAFLIVLYNFPSPQSDYAILPLISVSALTGIPLWLALLVNALRNRFCPSKDNKKQQEMPIITKEEQQKQQEKLLDKNNV